MRGYKFIHTISGYHSSIGLLMMFKYSRYDTALDINTGGPTRLMSFAKQCQKLKLFLWLWLGPVSSRARTENHSPDGWKEAGTWMNSGPIKNIFFFFWLNWLKYMVSRMMDPIILQYGKGQLTGFLVDPNGVLDVVSSYAKVITCLGPQSG